MSRCFSFPPPGYAGNCSSNEALILPIKLQRERVEANPGREREKKAKSSDNRKERKKEKKEKKEKKKEKRQQEKSHSASAGGKHKLVEELYQADRCRVEFKGKSILRQDDSGLLEKSSVTEEHGCPIESRNVSCSTDSTGNSSKRKRHATPTGIQSHGNVIKIRLPLSQKRDDPTTSGSKGCETSLSLWKREDPTTLYGSVRPCATARIETSNKQVDDIFKPPVDLSCTVSTSTATLQQVSRDDKEVPSLPDKKIEPLPPKEKEKFSSHEKKMRKKESKYEKLFENLDLPSLLSEPVIDEGDGDEWLFCRKDEERVAKRLKGSDVVQSFGENFSCSVSATLQPRAHFLPGAEIYAFPFTVPF